MNLKKRKVALFLTFLLMMSAGKASARVEVSGVIAGDTVWTSDDTILVTGFVTVADTAYLGIEAGTVVLFNSGIRIMVYGEMTAVGTVDSPIHFTAATDTAGGVPKPGDWYGLDFQVNSKGDLQYCRISYPIIGTYVYSAAVSFKNCLVENFMLYGIQVNGGSQTEPYVTTIERCTIRQTQSSALGKGAGIFAYQRALIDVSRTYIRQCETGLDIYSYNTSVPTFEVANCEISGNALYGIQIRSGG
jgi:hypothetical protein